LSDLQNAVPVPIASQWCGAPASTNIGVSDAVMTV